MNRISSITFLAALAASGLVSAAPAYTTPVGYITHTIAGNSGNSSDTYLSPTLVQPTIYAAASTATPTTNTVSLPTGVPTGLDSTYVLEITSGTSEGWWSTITSSTATSVVVNDTFPTGLTGNITVSIRKHNTVKTFLGANAPGLTPFNGVTASDEVQLLNPATQAVTTIAYVPKALSGASEDGWYNLANSSLADNYIVEPGTAVKIKHRNSSTLTFVSSGVVKTTKTQVDVFTDTNWIGTTFAVGNTLNGMALNTQLVTFNGQSQIYDELQYVNANQSVTPYAALNPSLGLGQTMGNLATSQDAGAVVFPEGSGAVLKRKGSANSIITFAGTTVGQ